MAPDEMDGWTPRAQRVRFSLPRAASRGHVDPHHHETGVGGVPHPLCVFDDCGLFGSLARRVGASTGRVWLVPCDPMTVRLLCLLSLVVGGCAAPIRAWQEAMRPVDHCVGSSDCYFIPSPGEVSTTGYPKLHQAQPVLGEVRGR